MDQCVFYNNNNKKTDKQQKKTTPNKQTKKATARLGEKESGEKTKQVLIKLIFSALNEEEILQERSTWSQKLHNLKTNH